VVDVDVVGVEVTGVIISLCGWILHELLACLATSPHRSPGEGREDKGMCVRA
jgi:hypothetical protein